jgi:hypothetical protein
VLRISEEPIAIEPKSVLRHEPVELKDNLSTPWPVLIILRYTPLLACHTRMVLSLDADASRVESCENATELT